MMSAALLALSAALLHFVWQGALIALALAVALNVARASTTRARYALSCGALLLMALSFCATFLWMLPPSSYDSADQPGSRLTAPTVAIHALPTADGQPYSSAPAWIVPVWIVGVALFYSYRIAGWFAAQRLRRSGVCLAPESWQKRVHELSRRIRLSRPVVLLESTLAQTPLTLGMLRPVILVPLGLLAGLPAAQIEAVLLHELAHIRRHDYLVNLAQSVIEGLLFYHPAVWWVSHRIRAEREFCCDDLVVAATNDAGSYVRALSALEHHRDLANQAALAATSGPLVLRVRRLLGRSAAPRAVSGSVLGLLALATCAALVAWQPEPAPVPEPIPVPAPAPKPEPVPAPQAQQAPQDRPRAELETPYRRWLDTEVLYVITPEERDAFLALITDDERQKFIEQFWQRRDPTPGSEQNEFREEHYRRIAWANDQFSFGQTPGWRAIRGAFYIAFGPPDRIVSATDPEPTEQWEYKYIEGLGSDVRASFILDIASGDYRLRIPISAPVDVLQREGFSVPSLDQMGLLRQLLRDSATSVR
jgi:GWxTD domain-containing protein